MSLRGCRVAVKEAVQSIRFLAVGYGQTILAFPADFVRGILTPSETGPQSALTLVGDTYRPSDLRANLGLPAATGPSPESRTILCSNGTSHRAFHVDRVWGLTEVERGQILPLPPHFRGDERKWLAGLFLYQDGVALIVNPGWLLNDRETPFLASMAGDTKAIAIRRVETETGPGTARPRILVAPNGSGHGEVAYNADHTSWKPR